ncbi:alpha/beta hydrolase family protein [Streptomyces sp. BE303]|uniref:alpha/beta hydrolase family protein n=1 Tax=Streptomyces sp. BE303 TaxID=3002528 RepID=UPI002E7668F9|nr:hypothetical protein [Streptomyces sp. BE303]MED7950057.1 hypothetical protein [Streptomyces sp. BE303]
MLRTPPPGSGMADPTITSVSRELNGRRRDYVVSIPHGDISCVSVLFHPFGANAELVLHGDGPGDYLISTLTGASRPASRLGVAVVAPQAVGRAVDGVSLAWRDHLKAARKVAAEVQEAFGVDRLTAGGLSMGGLEALVFAGSFAGEVDAVWAVNPIVDLAAWHDDIANGATSSNLRSLGADQLIRKEVGGFPAEASEQYARRSPLSLLDQLARVRVRLTWTPADTVVPRQREVHAHQLANLLRAAEGIVDEHVVTHLPGDDALDAGRFAHESCDTWSNIGWTTLCTEL